MLCQIGNPRAIWAFIALKTVSLKADAFDDLQVEKPIPIYTKR